MNAVFITGGAGFVGSHLVERLLQDESLYVTVYDNYTTGQPKFLEHLLPHPRLHIAHGSIGDTSTLRKSMAGHDTVVHLAANADIRHGADHPELDFQANVLGTQRVLEAMRAEHITTIFLASTGAVYGNTYVVPTPENCPFPKQTSFYGASKLAAEALVSAYSETFGFTGAIFRFVPMIGERYSHGHLFDFVKKLRANPESLTILGSGKERKYALYVGDAMDAVVHIMNNSMAVLPVFNIGNDDFYTISQAADWVCSEMKLSPKKTFTYTSWAGDNPNLWLDTSRIKALGWSAATSPEIAVRKTVQYLLENDWLLEART